MKATNLSLPRFTFLLCLPLVFLSCVTTIGPVKLEPVYSPYDGDDAREVEKFYSLLKPRVEDFNKAAGNYNAALWATYGWGLSNAVGTLIITGITKGLNDGGDTSAATNVALWGGIGLTISSGAMTAVGLSGQRDDKANILKLKYQYLQNIVKQFSTLSPDLITPPSGSSATDYQAKRQLAIQKLRNLSLSIQNGLLQPDPFQQKE